MADLEQFRTDTRQWLEKNAPPEMRQPLKNQDEVCWGGRKANYPAPVMKWRLPVHVPILPKYSPKIRLGGVCKKMMH